MRYLFNDKGVRGKQLLLKLYPEYSRSGLYWHTAKSVDSTEVVDRCKFKNGRSKKVSLWEEIVVLQEICKLREKLRSLCYQETKIGFWTC